MPACSHGDVGGGVEALNSRPLRQRQLATTVTHYNYTVGTRVVAVYRVQLYTVPAYRIARSVMGQSRTIAPSLLRSTSPRGLAGMRAARRFPIMN